MRCSSFSSLSESEKNQLYDYTKNIKHAMINDYEEMCKYWGGITFNQGDSFFVFWDINSIAGTVGVVTREAEARKEIFITSLNVNERDINKCEEILAHACKLCEGYVEVSIKLGIRENLLDIIPLLNQKGFKEVYKLYILRLRENFLPSQCVAAVCRALDKNNIKEFQYISNAAFMHSPNGSNISDEELEDILSEYVNNPEYAAVAYINDNIGAGMYTLSEKEGAGWIDSIAVKPELHGKGIGKAILYKAIEILRKHGLKDIKLTVMSSNENAYKLYINNGFEHEAVLSTWFEKKVL